MSIRRSKKVRFTSNMTHPDDVAKFYRTTEFTDQDAVKTEFVPSSEFRRRMVAEQRLKNMDALLTHANIDMAMTYKAKIYSMVCVKLAANKVPTSVIDETIQCCRWYLDENRLVQCLDYLCDQFIKYDITGVVL